MQLRFMSWEMNDLSLAWMYKWIVNERIFLFNLLFSPQGPLGSSFISRSMMQDFMQTFTLPIIITRLQLESFTSLEGLDKDGKKVHNLGYGETI